ncbi:MAG: N-acetylmuramoyl-L-alanine amidase [Gaiellaceae bacterium]
MKLVRVTALLLLASPATAQAAAPTLVARDVPLQAERSLTETAPRFTMAGLHWQGAGSVEFRTRGVGGRWSGWRPAAPEDDRPDRGGSEPVAPSGWRIGNPYWTGLSDRLEVRTRGTVRRVRAFYVSSLPERVPPRTVSAAAAPAIVPRLSWGANESIRRASPSYADAVRLAIVHHTAGSSSYTRAESAAIVRGILIYHVQGNRWNDLGYNFLVDKYGQVFEGRYGGMERNVIGAHAEGFNTGSVGVAVIGTYGAAGISAAAREALVSLLAWRLDVAHVNPLSTLTAISGGNERFPRGVPVFLRAVAAHRDTGLTECPGDALYAQLNELAGETSRTGLPKLYAPDVRGAVGGPVRFTALLSAALPWTVTVTDAAGNRIATGTGMGPGVDWTWDASAAAPGTYFWAIEGGGRLLPASGTVGGKAAALAISRAVASPAVVSPNGDGYADTTTISYFLAAPATVSATVAGATLFSESKPAGEHNFGFAGETLPDGAHTILLRARNGTEVTAQVPVVVNRTLGYARVESPLVSPNGDGRLDSVRATFLLGASADVRLRVLREGKWVANVFNGPLAVGEQTLAWDGRKPHGPLRDGAYELELTATNATGVVSQRVPVLVDTQPPAARLLSLTPLRVRIGEPGRLVVKVNATWSTIDRAKAGVVTIPSPAVLRSVRVVVRDLAGNAAEPLTYP